MLALRSSLRRFSTRTILRGSDKTPSTSTVEPQIPGFRAPGEIATNYEVATGTERYEYLKKLAGEEPWAELKPIHLTSRPTKKDPFVLHGSDPVRYIGCTGFPADTHEPIWLTARPDTINRCPHCGNAFKYELDHEAHH